MLARASVPVPSSLTELVNAPTARPEVPALRVTQGVVAPVLISADKPMYPTSARELRLQGAVVFDATISTDGHVRNLRVVSGHPLLQAAARHAVANWRYRPSLLNGVPQQVETRITVNFVLPK
jgi:protein TonB